MEVFSTAAAIGACIYAFFKVLDWVMEKLGWGV